MDGRRASIGFRTIIDRSGRACTILQLPRFIANRSGPGFFFFFFCPLLGTRTGTESHVEASWGIPATLFRKINHKLTARDLHSRKEILRTVPSPLNPNDVIWADLQRRKRDSLHSEGFTKACLSAMYMSKGFLKSS